MLLDTSGLLCLFHQAEPYHKEACELYRGARFRLTHGHALAEFVALAAARRLPRQAALEFIVDLVANCDIETLWADALLHERAMLLLRSRIDKSYSLCDALSFTVMRDRGIREALTTDRHFEQEGFQKLLGTGSK